MTEKFRILIRNLKDELILKQTETTVRFLRGLFVYIWRLTDLK